MELMYRICKDLTHKYELKSKRKKHQRIKQIQIKTGLKANQETKIIKNNTTWNWWQFRRNMTRQNTIGFKNQNDSKQHNMNILKLQ